MMEILCPRFYSNWFTWFGENGTYPHIEWFADAIFQQDVTAFDEAFSITPIQLRIPAQDSPVELAL